MVLLLNCIKTFFKKVMVFELFHFLILLYCTFFWIFKIVLDKKIYIYIKIENKKMFKYSFYS